MRKIRSLAALLALLACAEAERPVATASTPSGGQVFADHCAACHALPLMAYQVPQMRGRPPGFVYDALSEGAMRRMGAPLDEASRRAVAEFFTGVAFGSPRSERDYVISPPCTGEAARFDWSDRAHPSWGGTLRNHRSIATAQGFGRADLEHAHALGLVAAARAPGGVPRAEADDGHPAGRGMHESRNETQLGVQAAEGKLTVQLPVD